MFGLGFGELILIFLIALIFIGPKKLPELAKGLGKGIRDFQNAAKGFGDELKEDINSEPPKKIADASQQEEAAKPAADSTEKKETNQT
ncbi:MAG: twin-arginine translocase TatA/TatE family subunit [Bacteriovoracaceae bacterium]|nr:twin-arginine translocase TatA/TatE family subunit [Bacteriovoracaceae bacterium]